MINYKLRKSIIQRSHDSKIATDRVSGYIKDIKYHKSQSVEPNLDRVILKGHQRPRNKPSMPKMPWDEE